MVNVNLVAVLAAAIAALIIGYVWYMPGVFGKAWAKYSKRKMGGGGDASMMMMTMGGTLVASIVMAYFLAVVMNYAGAAGAIDGALIGVMMYVGFIAMATVNDVIYGGEPKELFGIEGGYQLVSLAVMGALIGSM